MKIKLICILTLGLLLVGCTTRYVLPFSASGVLLQAALDSLGPAHSQPRLVTGSLIVTVADMQHLDGQELETWNLEHEIPTGTPPTLLLWSAAITRQPNQFPLGSTTINRPPDDRFTDPLFGNPILFWDLSDVTDAAPIRIQRDFQYITTDYRPVIHANEVIQHWAEIPDSLYVFYTRVEPFLRQSPELQILALDLIAPAWGPLDEARRIHAWVNRNMTYVYPPEERGAEPAFQCLSGDCGQYSNLFIAMCRSVGIPARQQSGFNFAPKHLSYHVWSEIYLPPVGWVPVDATREDGFLHLDNRRLIASVGMNIPLKHSPVWAKFQNSEVEAGRTDFMQLVTMVQSGMEAEVTTERILKSSRELYPCFPGSE